MADCIAAISTPMASGGVSMIRISGADALEVAAKVFIPKHSVIELCTVCRNISVCGGIAVHLFNITHGVLRYYPQER